MTPGEARTVALMELPDPELGPFSERVDLTFDYDELNPSVAAALIARSDLGAERYGTHLHTFDGRGTAEVDHDFVNVDLVQELLDAAIYAQKEVVECEGSQERCYDNDVEDALAQARYMRDTILRMLGTLIG